MFKSIEYQQLGWQKRSMTFSN